MKRWMILLLSAIALVVLAGTATLFIVHSRRWSARLVTIQGAVIRHDSDPRKQLPISDAVITATHGTASVTVRSDESGYFKVTFPQLIWPGQTVSLAFHRPGYQPLQMNILMQFRSTTKRIFIAEMQPELSETSGASENEKSAQVISNIRIRYTENFQTEENIGSAVRTFEVENRGNVPCRHQFPCSPDGNWKASRNSITLDAGLGNTFHNVRASCIAGPCPFTRIDSAAFTHPGRMIEVSATAWSNTVTFLVEGEVFRTSIGSSVRHSYPLIFGRTLNFTLPPTEEGVSIEAELNGTPMVFPLGPDLYLSWASCTARTNSASKSTAYRCELKPGYRF